MNIFCRLFDHKWKEDPENKFRKECTRKKCHAFKTAMCNPITFDHIEWKVVDLDLWCSSLLEPKWKFWIHKKKHTYYRKNK